MTDHSDFEARLATAFSAYADRAPVEVDPISMTATVVRGRSRRAWPRFNRHVSWLLIGAVLAVLAVGAALLAGSLLLRPRSIDLAVLNLAEAQSSWTSIGTRRWPYHMGNQTIMVTSPLHMVITPAGTLSTASTVRTEIWGSVSLTATGALEVRLLSTLPGRGCDDAASGTYRIGLSPGGQDMTLALVGDACPARPAMLDGVWTRTDIGPLVSGDHVSRLYRPFGTTGTFSYTVPNGWEEADECTSCFTLVKVDDPAALTIHLMASVVPRSLGFGCRDMVDDAGSTPVEIADWLATRPNLEVAQARPLVTIGGLNGVAVDLTVRPDTGSLPCRFLDSEGGDVTLVDPGVPDAQLAIQSLNNTRILLLDGGDGRIMAIVIEADYMGDWETELEEAMGIVESFEFAR